MLLPEHGRDVGLVDVTGSDGTTGGRMDQPEVRDAGPFEGLLDDAAHPHDGHSLPDKRPEYLESCLGGCLLVVAKDLEVDVGLRLEPCRSQGGVKRLSRQTTALPERLELDSAPRAPFTDKGEAREGRAQVFRVIERGALLIGFGGHAESQSGR